MAMIKEIIIGILIATIILLSLKISKIKVFGRKLRAKEKIFLVAILIVLIIFSSLIITLAITLAVILIIIFFVYSLFRRR